MRLKVSFAAADVSMLGDDVKRAATAFAEALAAKTNAFKKTRKTAEDKVRVTVATNTSKEDKFKVFKAHLEAKLETGFATLAALEKALDETTDNNYKSATLKALNKNIWSFPGLALARLTKLTLVAEATNHDVRLSIGNIQDLTQVHSASVSIGKLYVDNSRFQEIATGEKGLLNKVFTRIGGSPREYVGLPMGKSTVYVRRYVIRGLNVNDSENLSDKQGLQAASSDEELVHKETTAIASGRINRQHGTTMTVGEQLLSHTRGWNKRFISTTLTHKPITSTKGLFNSAFGKILIDLAKIPPEDIFDIHTPTALQHYGVYGGELKQLPSMKAQDQRSFFDETLLAAYDAIRTREVLIKGKIPFDSILCKSLGNLVVAVYCDDEPLKQSLFQKIEAAWKKASNPVSHKEELQYEIKSRKLVFYRFADAATAGKAVATAQAQLTAQDNAGAYAMAAFDFPEKIPPGAGTA